MQNLVGNLKGKLPRSDLRWKGNIKTYLKGIWWDSIGFAQNMV
jgi:hypothetical protein